MNIFKATADFERWLAGQLPIIRQDLALKHQQWRKPRSLFSTPASTAGYKSGRRFALI